jgi:hypothetical protein
MLSCNHFGVSTLTFHFKNFVKKILAAMRGVPPSVLDKVKIRNGLLLFEEFNLK